jgi:hypothetical protein
MSLKGVVPPVEVRNKIIRAIKLALIVIAGILSFLLGVTYSITHAAVADKMSKKYNVELTLNNLTENIIRFEKSDIVPNIAVMRKQIPTFDKTYETYIKSQPVQSRLRMVVDWMLTNLSESQLKKLEDPNEDFGNMLPKRFQEEIIEIISTGLQLAKNQ